MWGLYDETTGCNYPIGDIIKVFAYLEAYKKKLKEKHISFDLYPMIEKFYTEEEMNIYKYPICNSIEEFLDEIFT